MKPTLKDYIKRMSDDELYAHFDLVLKEMNERKAKERGEDDGREKEKL